jgi:hypothetical protein
MKWSRSAMSRRFRATHAEHSQNRLSLVHDEIQDETDYDNQSNDIDNVIHLPNRL